jgi:5-formyltetrahydrofolate cyclo-ligase
MPPDPTTIDLKARKRELRSQLISARTRLTPVERSDRSERIAERLAGLDLLRGASVVGLYAALGTEVDVAPVARLVLERGGRIAYPRTVPGSRQLVYCACWPAELVRGPLGAAEPPADARQIPLGDIDCFLMPGVGYSRDGLRLGRGGGYYDVTLKQALAATRIGVGFAVQLVDALPREPHDVPLDAVVTEDETLLFPREPGP